MSVHILELSSLWTSEMNKLSLKSLETPKWPIISLGRLLVLVLPPPPPPTPSSLPRLYPDITQLLKSISTVNQCAIYSTPCHRCKSNMYLIDQVHGISKQFSIQWSGYCHNFIWSCLWKTLHYQHTINFSGSINNVCPFHTCDEPSENHMWGIQHSNHPYL